MNPWRAVTKLKLWQIDGAGLGVCAALALLWWALGWQPLSDASAARDALAEQLREKDDKITTGLHDRAREELQVGFLQTQIHKCQVQLQGVESLNRRVGELNKLASEHGLRVDEIKPGTPEVLSRYTRVPVRVAGAGGFRACAAFLHELRATCPDTGVLGLQLRAEPESPDKSPTFSFDLVWYAEPPGSAPAVRTPAQASQSAPPAPPAQAAPGAKK